MGPMGPTGPTRPMARRTAVAVLGTAALGACTRTSTGPARPSVAASASGGTAPVLPPSSTAPAPPEALPDVRRWRPSPADVSPECKVAAVRELERRGNGRGAALEVVAAQYGGILTDSASVLVVCRTWRRRAGEVVPGGRTFDVRLTRGAVAGE